MDVLEYALKKLDNARKNDDGSEESEATIKYWEKVVKEVQG